MIQGELFKSGFLSDYLYEIADYISGGSVCALEAPTGSGKTTLLSGYIQKKKLYKGLVDIFPNSIVLVPHNATLGLYSSIYTISSKNNNRPKTGSPMCMIWDQFNKHYGFIKDNLPKVIFVDESHTLFLDQVYRNEATTLLNHLLELKSMGVKIVCISATPAGELNVLGIDPDNDYMVYDREDDRNIVFNIINTQDTYKSMLRDIRTETADYDAVCVFSDRDVAQLYGEAYSKEMNAKLYHSKWEEYVAELRENETVNTDICLFTCIAFNGLNIRNTFDKVLIDMRYTQGNTTLNEIIQIIGRFRNVKNIEVRFYVDGKYRSETDEELMQSFSDAEIMCECDSDEFNTPYYKRLADPATQDVLQSINDYRMQWNLRKLVGDKNNPGELQRRGYEVHLLRDTVKNSKRSNPIKRAASDKFKENPIEIRDGKILIEDKEEKKYVDRWIKEINSLTMNCGGKYDYDKIWDAFLNTLNNKANVQTRVDQFMVMIKVHDMSEEKWKMFLTDGERLLDPTKAKLTKKCYKDVKKLVNSYIKIREKVKDLDLGGVIDSINESIECELEAFKIGNSKGGKKKGKKNNVKKITDGKLVWNSCKEAALMLGVSSTTVTKRLKNGLLWKIDSGVGF